MTEIWRFGDLQGRGSMTTSVGFELWVAEGGSFADFLGVISASFKSERGRDCIVTVLMVALWYS